MSKVIVPIQRIAQAIFVVRGQKVMLSQDLAALYGVAVKALNQAVKRHAARFPADLVYQLTTDEFTNLKSQIVTSSWGDEEIAGIFDWGAHASRVWVSASRRNELPVQSSLSLDLLQSSQWRDTIASTRDACAPLQ
jgi:hypothetical protein